MAAPPGMAYTAVGMQRALDSEIGLPSRSTRVLRMLSLEMAHEVSRNFMMVSFPIHEEPKVFSGPIACKTFYRLTSAKNFSYLALSLLRVICGVGMNRPQGVTSEGLQASQFFYSNGYF